jgi:hypothetical protein
MIKKLRIKHFVDAIFSLFKKESFFLQKFNSRNLTAFCAFCIKLKRQPQNLKNYIKLIFIFIFWKTKKIRRNETDIACTLMKIFLQNKL